MEDRLSVLVADAAAGDQSAFYEIVKMFEPLIGNIIKKYNFRMAGYDDDDLRQEAVIALYGAVRTFDLQSTGVTFGLYAKICINNRIISRIRSSRNDIIPVNLEMQDAEDGESVYGTDINPESEIIGRESYNALLNLIDENLTAYEKSVFKLYILGKSYREIAVSLNSSQKSVDNAIYRIKSKIKKLI